MTDREFKVQVMERLPQWQGGLRSRLHLTSEGLSLFAIPAFDSCLTVRNWPTEAGDVVVDECGQVYWTATKSRGKGEEKSYSLYRQNPTTNQTEHVIDFTGCGSIEPREIWLTEEYLWVFDRRGSRLVALSRTNLQIAHEIRIEKTLVDMNVDLAGYLYAIVVDTNEKSIYRYSLRARDFGELTIFTEKEVSRAKGSADTGSKNLPTWSGVVALAVAPNGDLYLLDNEVGRFIRINPNSKTAVDVGESAADLLKGLQPSAMQIDSRGVLFIAANDPARLHLFDADGSYLGAKVVGAGKTGWLGVELPPQIKRIRGVGFDPNGDVYLATDECIAKFTLARNAVGLDGLFYSQTLDNGTRAGTWHRLALQGELPTKTAIEVHYYSSEDDALRQKYDEVLSGNLSNEEKVAGVEHLLSPLWKGPETFIGSEPAGSRGVNAFKLSLSDMLFEKNEGRFLWLKIRLVTFDEKVRPSIKAARIYYQRLSYLRYLPPVYREDPVSAGFLERFLSLFETVFDGLDQEIDQLFQYFDPRLAQAGFLPWLGSWINLFIDEDLPTDRVRRLIRSAPDLYRRKGTASAIREFLEIYTGRRVFLIEQTRALRPLIVGAPNFRLGDKTLLLGGTARGFRVGDTSIVGHAVVRDRVGDPDEPFLPLVRRFTLLIDMDRPKFQEILGKLQRLVDEQKPTHTVCAIRLLSDQTMVGTAILGASAPLTSTPSYQVGITPLGAGAAIAHAPDRLRVERGASAGGVARL